MDQSQYPEGSLEEEYSQETYMEEDTLRNQMVQGNYNDKSKSMLKDAPFARESILRRTPRKYIVHDELQQLMEDQGKFAAVNVIPPEILQPFIPDYIPAIGEIDSCLKVPRPDGKQEFLGIKQIDEPPLKQSNPSVLTLQLAKLSNKPFVTMDNSCGQIQTEDPFFENKVDEWINNIQDIYTQKIGLKNNLNRQRIQDLTQYYQEWSPQLQQITQNVFVLDESMDIDISNLSTICCSILDIPTNQSAIQSLHILFSIYIDIIRSPFTQQETTQTFDQNWRQEPLLSSN